MIFCKSSYSIFHFSSINVKSEKCDSLSIPRYIRGDIDGPEISVGTSHVIWPKSGHIPRKLDQAWPMLFWESIQQYTQIKGLRERRIFVLGEEGYYFCSLLIWTGMTAVNRWIWGFPYIVFALIIIERPDKNEKRNIGQITRNKFTPIERVVRKPWRH